MAPTDNAVSVAIDNILMYFGKHGSKPISVPNFHGLNIEINKRFLKNLRTREDNYRSKKSSRSRKNKDISPEKRSQVIDSLTDKVTYALQHSQGVKVSPDLQKTVLSHLGRSLESEKKNLLESKFSPKRLVFIDDHLAHFIENIRLNLLENVDSSAAMTKEIKAVEDSILNVLRTDQVVAPTVFSSVMNRYIEVNNLRQASGEFKSHIRMDAALKKLAMAPIDSLLKGKSFAKSYVPSNETKKSKSEDGEVEIQSLGGFRKENPGRSVFDYFLSTSSPKNKNVLKNNYLLGEHLMALMSAHLIQGSPDNASHQEMLSMETANGHFVNPRVNTMITLQVFIKGSKVNPQTTRPVDVSARSPSRSVPRSATRSARSPSRSPSRGVRRK